MDSLLYQIDGQSCMNWWKGYTQHRNCMMANLWFVRLWEYMPLLENEEVERDKGGVFKANKLESKLVLDIYRFPQPGPWLKE